MFSNLLPLSETDLLSYGRFQLNTQCLPNAIYFAETASAIGISTNKPKSTLLATEHHLLSGCQLAGLNLPEDDTSLVTTGANDHQCWAEREFGNAPLGDVRRVKRLIQLGQQRGASPNASIPQACGSHAATKAAYRFYDNNAIKPSAILVSHQQATTERMSNQSLVLAVQDTTQLDYTDHPQTKGLGTLNDDKHHGLLVHTTLAVTTERVPLGIIQQQVWTRPVEEFGKKHSRKQRPIEDKESYKWLSSLQETAKLQQQLPDTQIVSVGDREADVYELFVQAKQLSQPILIRASWNRCVDHPEKYLWEQLQSHPLAGTLTITVPRQQNQQKREATLSIRYALVRLRPPHRPKGVKLPSITVSAVLALEEQPPPGIKPLQWLLLTTVAVYTFDDACERLGWYTCRWVIEVYHKVLKSGCRVQQRQFEEVQRIRRYLAVDDVVAWRVLFLTMLGRELPKMPCDAILEAHEWQALYCFIHQTHTPPPKTPTLACATLWIAKLGGFLARKGDGQPGVTVIWRGLQRLQDVANAFQLFRTNTYESGG